MKDKHIYIKKDSDLLKKIHKEIKQEISKSSKTYKLKLILKAVFYLTTASAAYFTIFHTESVLVLFLAYILFGLTSLLIVFNYGHDLSHGTFFKNKWLNNFLYTVIFTGVGAHAASWKRRHLNAHHYAPNVKDYDTDLQINKLIRVEPSADLKWYHKYQHLYAPFAYTTYSLYWAVLKDLIVYSKEFRSYNLKEHFSFWIQKLTYITYLIVLPSLITNHGYSTIIIAFITMHLVQSVFLLFTFFITHHVEKTEYFEANEQGYIETSWFNNQIKSSNDFYPFSEVANMIFGGFNNHVAHHLFPNINHVHYPRLNKIIYRILNENGIQPNQSTYFGGVVSHLKHLKLMGR